jgi:hypothetical protein
MSIKWKREFISKWYDEVYYAFVHHHHDNEELIYVPWIKSKAVLMPDVTTVDHKTLMDKLDNFKKLF